MEYMGHVEGHELRGLDTGYWNEWCGRKKCRLKGYDEMCGSKESRGVQ